MEFKKGLTGVTEIRAVMSLRIDRSPSFFLCLSLFLFLFYRSLNLPPLFQDPSSLSTASSTPALSLSLLVQWGIRTMHGSRGELESRWPYISHHRIILSGYQQISTYTSTVLSCKGSKSCNNKYAHTHPYRPQLCSQWKECCTETV